MTRGVAIARDRVFLFVRGGHTVPPMSATISFPVFRRTHRRTLSDLLEDGVAIGFARSDDRRELQRLAALDSSDVLDGPVVTGRIDGELCAAVSLYDGRTIANPFVRTRELVDALRKLAR
jgi:hypothetical protein